MYVYIYIYKEISLLELKTKKNCHPPTWSALPLALVSPCPSYMGVSFKFHPGNSWGFKSTIWMCAGMWVRFSSHWWELLSERFWQVNVLSIFLVYLLFGFFCLSIFAREHKCDNVSVYLSLFISKSSPLWVNFCFSEHVCARLYEGICEHEHTC